MNSRLHNGSFLLGKEKEEGSGQGPKGDCRGSFISPQDR